MPERDQGEGAVRILDTAYLAAQTFGDRALEREVLTLFVEQLTAASRCFGEGDGELVHKLKGAALGVGAFALAQACAAMEQHHDGAHALEAAVARTLDAARARLAQTVSDA